MKTTNESWNCVRSFRVRQLAAAFSPASLLAANSALDGNFSEQAHAEESGSELPHSKAPQPGVSRHVDLKPPTTATYLRTLRHLRWSQLGYLALRRVLPQSHAPAKIGAPVRLRELSGRWRFMDWQPEASRKMVAAREFTFLHQTVAASGAIPWNDRRHEKLWLYHLNYFDFLNIGFTLPAEKATLLAAFEITLDWCAQNTQGTEVGWEPYALSVRIINWLKFLVRHGRSLELLAVGEKLQTLVESLGAQVATLERRLEKDLLANHLLKNTKALLFAGALLETSSSARWWTKGEKLLERELDEQILPDGGHFERSPMYHAQILEDLAEISNVSAATGQDLTCSGLLAEKIRSMSRFLKGILHPDGEIPLFNDSVLGATPPPAELLARTASIHVEGPKSEPEVMVFANSGYGAIRSPESRSAVIFDCGPLGPNYQPGHGHCDVLSYELSLHGQRVVVDTGASTYEASPERSFERSTAAHNTLRIDGEEQAETWASFRVGRRPQVGRMSGGRDGDFYFLRGKHAAYRRLGVVHSRTILLLPPETWIVADLLVGEGSHRVESFLHFHPRVRVRPAAETPEAASGLDLRCWSVAFNDQTYRLAIFGSAELAFSAAWYSEDFGNRRPSTALRWTWQGAMPMGTFHVLAPVDASLPRLVPDWPGRSIEVEGHRIPLM